MGRRNALNCAPRGRAEPIARTAGVVLSRARVHTAALVLAALVVTALMPVPISVASAGHGGPTTGGANQLLRQFPVGTRRLCCTTSGSNAVTPPSRRSSSAGPTVPAGSSAGAGSGHALSTVGLVAVAIALLIVGLDTVVARGRRSRRRRPGKSRTGRTPTAAENAAHQLVVRSDARKRALQAEERQPIDEPPDRPEAAPATATNGRVTAHKHVLLDRADASKADQVVVRRWRQNPVGAQDAAPAQQVKNPVPEDAPVASVEPDSPDSPATTAGDVPGLVPPARSVMPADDPIPPRPGDANSAATDFELAVRLHERGELDAAAVAYQRAELRGEPEAAFSLGVLLYEAGDLPGAEDAWRRCLSSEHARAATNLGFLLEQRGELRKALLAYSAADRWGDPEGRRLGAALLRTAKGLPPVGL